MLLPGCLIAPVTAKKSTRKTTKSPKSYGRQRTNQTITSLSLDKELLKAGKALAKKRKISFSQLINEMLAEANGIPKPQDVQDP